MEIKAKSTFDYESIKALSRLSLFRRADPKKRMILWGVVYATLLLVIILDMVVFGYDTFLLQIGILTVLVYFLISFLFFLLPKIQYKALGQMKGIVNEYVFTDDHIHTTSKGAEYNGEAQIQYSLLVKVMETSEYFFMFQNNSQVLLVHKPTIVGGTADDIRNKLSSYLGKKYIVCKY